MMVFVFQEVRMTCSHVWITIIVITGSKKSIFGEFCQVIWLMKWQLLAQKNSAKIVVFDRKIAIGVIQTYEQVILTS